MTKDQGPGTIHEAAAAMRAGTLTPVGLLEQCLRRIDLYEPHVRAWVVVDRDGAREQAERLTAQLKRGQNRGPLHGIPVGIKDIIDVFDLPTGCGSKLWANSIARQDAACVKKLRQAGAVILGKTVTTPFAFLDPPVTRNPWNLARTPGGSSSGSAAAVACGMCLGALGTQTGGSLTRPASFCGVASCKPSWGRVSVEGVLPFAPSLDHVGVMARCVRDLAMLLQPIVDHDSRAIDPHVDRYRLRDRPPPGTYLFGRLRHRFEDLATPDMRDQIDAVISKLTDSVEGNAIEMAWPPELTDVWSHHQILMSAGAANTHAERFRRHPDDYPPKIAALITEGQTRSADEAVRALFGRDEAIGAASSRFCSADALLTPAARGPAPGPETTGDAVFNAPWSYLKLPTISFPIGVVDSLPVAVQLVGKPLGERDLFTVAAWCEERIGCKMDWPPMPG